MYGRQHKYQNDKVHAVLLERHRSPVLSCRIHDKHLTPLLVHLFVTAHNVDGSGREVTAKHAKRAVLAVLEYGEDRVADATAYLENPSSQSCCGVAGRRFRCSRFVHMHLTGTGVVWCQFGELGEQPVAILEKAILVNVVERIPKFVGIGFKFVQLLIVERHVAVFRDASSGQFLLFVVPFHVIPANKDASQIIEACLTKILCTRRCDHRLDAGRSRTERQAGVSCETGYRRWRQYTENALARRVAQLGQQPFRTDLI